MRGRLHDPPRIRRAARNAGRQAVRLRIVLRLARLHQLLRPRQHHHGIAWLRGPARCRCRCRRCPARLPKDPAFRRRAWARDRWAWEAGADTARRSAATFCARLALGVAAWRRTLRLRQKRERRQRRGQSNPISCPSHLPSFVGREEVQLAPVREHDALRDAQVRTVARLAIR